MTWGFCPALSKNGVDLGVMSGHLHHTTPIINSYYTVTIWKVVFANKSLKFGWIWMKLGRWG